MEFGANQMDEETLWAEGQAYYPVAVINVEGVGRRTESSDWNEVKG